MSRRNSFLVLGLLVAALVGVALLAAPGSPLHKSPTLGLDLQGGLEAAPGVPRRTVISPRKTSTARSRSCATASTSSVSRAEIRTQGDDQIVIQLPASRIPAAAEIIGTTAQLELFDLEASLIGPSTNIRGEPVDTSLYGLLAQVQAQVKDGESEAYYVVNTKTKRVVSGPYGSERSASRSGRRAARRTRDLRGARRDGRRDMRRGRGRVPRCGGAGVAPDRTYYYLFDYTRPRCRR